MKLAWLLPGFVCYFFSAVGHAGQSLSPQEALQLLNRVNAASRQIAFTGIYVYQRGGTVETSRISHAVIGGVDLEKIEAVDGPAQELIVQNDQLSCYVPNNRVGSIDLRASDHFFPSVLPKDVKPLLANYHAIKQDVERVADNDCQAILLTPKDGLRNPFRFCYEPTSGVILKSQRYNDQQELTEQMSFTQVKIGVALDRAAFKPKFPKKVGTWQRQSQMAKPEDIEINGKMLPAGFKLVHGGKRVFPGKAKPVSHYLFSDGLASVSVFLDSAADDVVLQSGMSRKDETNIYVESEGNVVMMILGDVPAQAVQQFGMSLGIKK
ncbi:MucB/RseB C-terminal domain-containing protein [Leeia oryzae]|uniref:MucB/RseB C-terminal domain-containing protein n=1 Tax=Leeia oryzae TaxID=356662 RepID=UPI0003746319|nr:MucB/RseB C-terminal domain-containing protein [Leeia oryzae]